MRLIFHGELRKLYGESVVMHADNVGQAIEGFSRQQPDWPRDMRISVVGFDTPEKLKEQADEVHLMPALYGGGGKWGTIILGAAMIGLAFALPGIGIAISAALKVSLIVSGGMMLLQGVLGMFMKAPKAEKSEEQSRYLGINSNTVGANTPITMAWGRIDLHPHWLSLQSDSTNLTHGTFPASPT